MAKKIYPWEKLKKSGDSFIADDYSEMNQCKRRNISNTAKRLGFSITYKILPDGRTQVWRR